MRRTGTRAIGIRLPIVRQGEDLADIVVNSLMLAGRSDGIVIHERDVVAITESIVARNQGNYATLENISDDVRAKFPGGEMAVVFPILSRNRFSLLLRGLSMGVDRLILQLSYPGDEVGNQLITWDMVDEKDIDPYRDVLDEAEFRRLFGEVKHPFTGIDYVSYYKSLAPNIEIIFSNDPRTALNYTKHVLCADIHTRARTKRLLKNAGAETVLGLDDLLTAPVNGSGYNQTYGLLGSNMSTDDRVKLFPRDAQPLVDRIQALIKEKTGCAVEVMIYGDGAFKDPVGGIWELADPVVSPFYTRGLEGTPNELKMKYLADTKLAGLSGDEAVEAMKEEIRRKDPILGDSIAAQGTTPRRLTDLLGSLCDLTSGSGDKGTPVVLIQGYFDNYATE